MVLNSQEPELFMIVYILWTWILIAQKPNSGLILNIAIDVFEVPTNVIIQSF